MVGDVVIGLAAVGTLSSIADILLTPDQKKYLNEKVVRLRDWLARISADRVVNRARGRWVFFLTLGIPLLDQVISGYLHAGWDYVYSDLILSAPAFLVCAPLVWWITHSSDFRNLVARAFISSVALYIAYGLIIHIATLMFVSDTDDLIMWALFPGRALRMMMQSIFVLAIILPLIPVPLARLSMRLLKGVLWIFQRCIEHNKGAFLALCIIIGAVGALMKNFIGK